MTNAAGNPPSDEAYVAHLWDFPQLTIAFFGLQFQSPEAYQMYEQAGIAAQIREDLARTDGMLCMREFQEGNGGVLMQYWRSHEDLSNYSKRLPHMNWWKWLIDNDGKGLSFYHEIYQCKSAEAIFERGTAAVGPGAFCETSPSELGGGRSGERQRRFEEAAKA